MMQIQMNDWLSMLDKGITGSNVFLFFFLAELTISYHLGISFVSHILT